MRASPRIVFHVGGPEFHPVSDQAQAVSSWLGSACRCECYDGVDAFENLGDDCDLLVLMGLHWTGMAAGPNPLPYRPMSERHQAAFERYIASGRPLIAHHGAVASYDDWPRFGELVGVAWVWGLSNHSPVQRHTVQVQPPPHPLTAGTGDFEIVDELYYGLTINPALQVHAVATWERADHPMVLSAEGGRIAGSGKIVYLANGHDMRAFQSPALRRLWTNAIAWALGSNGRACKSGDAADLEGRSSL